MKNYTFCSEEDAQTILRIKTTVIKFNFNRDKLIRGTNRGVKSVKSYPRVVGSLYHKLQTTLYICMWRVWCGSHATNVKNYLERFTTHATVSPPQIMCKERTGSEIGMRRKRVERGGDVWRDRDEMTETNWAGIVGVGGRYWMNLIVMGTVSRWFSILTRRLIDVLSFAKLVMDYFVESGDERWSVSTDSIRLVMILNLSYISKVSMLQLFLSMNRPLTLITRVWTRLRDMEKGLFNISYRLYILINEFVK